MPQGTARREGREAARGSLNSECGHTLFAGSGHMGLGLTRWALKLGPMRPKSRHRQGQLHDPQRRDLLRTLELRPAEVLARRAKCRER